VFNNIGTVIHCAARVHQMRDKSSDPLAEFRKVNRDATLLLAKTAIDANVKKFIFFSTLKVMGDCGIKGHIFRENDPPHPTDPYGQSKYEAEEGLRSLFMNQEGCHCIVIRLPMVYGEGNKGNVLGLLSAAYGKKVLPIKAAKAKRSMVYVGNITSAVIRILSKPQITGSGYCTYFLTDEIDHSSAELYSAIYACMNYGANGLVYVPSFIFKGISIINGKLGDIVLRLFDEYRCSSDLFRKTYEWIPPIDVKLGIQKLVIWYKDQNMRPKKLWDPNKNQLLFFENQADPEFWDKHWEKDLNKFKEKLVASRNDFVSNITSKYLNPTDGIILEGGCGDGQNVLSLKKHRYNVIGIDYAEKTVRILNQIMPELAIQKGDVRNLPFKDEYFSGYWSLGVIEHFYEGYQSIAIEMHRVIKTGGYLFLTFPYMSFLRKMKGWFGFYESWKNNEPINNFYQFALNADLTINDFRNLGFEIVKKMPLDGLKGTKDEIHLFHATLQKLYDYHGCSLILKILRKSVLMLTTPFAGHSILLILKKCR
jgi:nucleoside-diphosphate-sugar epimerase/ubiquinone/menaquinone biosynthesis C-methylase UbiE